MAPEGPCHSCEVRQEALVSIGWPALMARWEQVKDLTEAAHTD